MLSRIPLLCIPLLSLSAFATPTTFTAEPLDENQTLVRTEQQYLDMSMALRVDGQPMGAFTATNTRRAQVTLTIEKWKDKKRAAQFVFGTHENKEIQTLPNGATDVKETPFPLEGKTISVVWSSKSDELVFSQDNGQELSEAEHNAMLKEWNKVKDMKQGPFEEAINGIPLELNKEVPLDEATLIKMLNIGDQDLNVSKPTIVFTEVREHGGVQCGVFTIDVDFAPKQNELNMTMAMKGTLILSIDGMDLHALTMEGPMTLSAKGVKNGQTMEMTGGGTASFNNTIEYQR